MNSFSTGDILPPSPQASLQALTNWFGRGLVFITTPTNALEARLAAVSVLMDVAQNRTGIPECKHYAETLTNESVKLACAQLVGRVKEYGVLSDKRDKPDADTIAPGQSLMNQGFAMLKSFANKSLTGEIATVLPGLASKLSRQRELLFVCQMRFADALNAFLSKEQAVRTGSFIVWTNVEHSFRFEKLTE